MLMGRKTYESIGKALPGRINLVLSRSSGFAPGGLHRGVERSMRRRGSRRGAQSAPDGDRRRAKSTANACRSPHAST